MVGRQLNGIARYDSSWRSASEIAVPSLLECLQIHQRAREDGGRCADPDHEDRERDQELDQPHSLLRANEGQARAKGHVQPVVGHCRHVRGATFQARVVVALPIDPLGTTFVTANDEPPVIDA